MSPIRKLADTSRQLPLRNISKLILDIREGRETLAMIGIRKPSLHYYSRQKVFYEPNTEGGLINLSERLNTDRRENYEDQPDYEYKSLLVVIDEYSSRREQWSKINHQKLGKFGIYNLWRIQKSDLNESSRLLVKSGYKSDWENRKVEKFKHSLFLRRAFFKSSMLHLLGISILFKSSINSRSMTESSAKTKNFINAYPHILSHLWDKP